MAGPYYVYEYIHPRTQEVLYVGKGQRGRAWEYHPYIEGHLSQQRGPELLAALEALGREGFHVEDWVRIRVRNLSKEAASKIERALIEDRATPYNKQYRPRIASAPHKPAASEHDPRQIEFDL